MSLGTASEIIKILSFVFFVKSAFKMLEIGFCGMCQ